MFPFRADLRGSILAFSLVAAGAIAAGCSEVAEESLVARSSATEEAPEETGDETPGTKTPSTKTPSTKTPGAVVATEACTAACADTSTPSNAAVCYSCRCKDALGDLPTPEELRCSTGDAIKTFKLEDGAEVEITEDATDGECTNPALLGDVDKSVACLAGSRLGQITKGGSHFKFICRKKAHRAAGGANRFDDFGIIGHNPRTGATCFWDDNDGALARGAYDGESIPAIDLTRGETSLVDAYTEVFSDASAATSCLGCHDNDPFLYTSFLKGTSFANPRAIRMGRYWRVAMDGTRAATGNEYLTSPAARACTSCHRIGKHNTLTTFSLDSMGIKSSTRPYPASLVAGDSTYPLAFWMSDSLPATLDAWNEQFGTAKALIERCGADPSAAGCTWAAIPGPE